MHHEKQQSLVILPYGLTPQLICNCIVVRVPTLLTSYYLTYFLLPTTIFSTLVQVQSLVVPTCTPRLWLYYHYHHYFQEIYLPNRSPTHFRTFALESTPPAPARSNQRTLRNFTPRCPPPTCILHSIPYPLCTEQVHESTFVHITSLDQCLSTDCKPSR